VGTVVVLTEFKAGPEASPSVLNIASSAAMAAARAAAWEAIWLGGANNGQYW